MDIILAINALNAIISMIGNAQAQATKVGALIADLQSNERKMTPEEKQELKAAAKAARAYALAADPDVPTLV